MLYAKLAKVTKTKVIQKFQTYNFAFGGFWTAVEEFEENALQPKNLSQILWKLTEAGNLKYPPRLILTAVLRWPPRLILTKAGDLI